MPTTSLTDGIRAVAFDLDGTLVDTAPDLVATMNRVLAAIGGAALAPDRIRALIGGGVDQLVAKSLVLGLGEEGREETRFIEALALFRRLYGERLYVESRVFPGVAEGLRALARAGIGLACVTNKESRFALPVIEAAGLGGLIEFTLCGDRPEERKPRPDLLLAACERLGVAPREMLYVGDSHRDLEAARAAGCRIALVDYGYDGGVPVREAGADGVLGSVVELDGLGRTRAVP